MPENGTTGQTRDVDDEPTEQLEPVVDPGPDSDNLTDEDFLNDLDVVLTDEWP